MKNIKFDLTYKKDHNGLIEDYSGVIITGYYSSRTREPTLAIKPSFQTGIVFALRDSPTTESAR